MTYFALVATDPADHERVSADLREILTTFPTSQPVSVPAALETTVEVQADQQSAGNDPAASARAARSFYADVAKAIGRALTDQDKAFAKAQRKAGASVAQVARVIATGDGQAELPTWTPNQPEPIQASPSQQAIDVEALVAEMRAKLMSQSTATQAAPTAQPTSNQRVKYESIPSSAQLSQAVCNELQVWAQSLTGDMITGRKGAVVAYATGQSNGAQRVMEAYGAKLPKFLSKLNQLVNS